MTKHIVAPIDEIQPGQRKVVEVAGRSIGIFNVNGEFFALRNQCPHQGGPLCSGIVSGFLTSPAPGEFEYVRRGEFVRCPWHGWEFDIKTGHSWFDPMKMRVRSYDVQITSLTEANAAADAEEGLEIQPGPYQAETYPVSIAPDPDSQQDGELYIMIDIGR